MPRYALIAEDPETDAESVAGLRTYAQPVPLRTVRRLGSGRPALRPIVEIVPDYDPATERLTGAVAHAVFPDRVEETKEIAPLSDEEVRAQARPAVEATIDALIQVVDLLAQRYRARIAWLGERGTAVADLLPQESLDALTAWRNARRHDGATGGVRHSWRDGGVR